MTDEISKHMKNDMILIVSIIIIATIIHIVFRVDDLIMIVAIIVFVLFIIIKSVLKLWKNKL